MKCPVCGKENMSMLCPECGFDSSRDYGRYPAFGQVGKGPSASALREERRKKEQPPASAQARQEQNPPPVPEPKAHPAPLPEKAGPEQKSPEVQKKPVQLEPEEEPWYMAPWIVMTRYMALVLMIIGIIVTVMNLRTVSEPEETAPMQGETVEMTEETVQDPVPSEPWQSNVLRSDEVPELVSPSTYPVLGSEYLRWQIATVTLLDTLADATDDAWDVSADGTGSVMAWVKPNEALYDLYIGAEGGVRAGESCRFLFAGYCNVSQINFADAFHTDGTQDMGYMFYCCCNSLRTLDLSSFVTAQVEDMNRMFFDCAVLTDLILGDRFDTAQVQDMSYMFFKCPAGSDWKHLLK